MTIQQAFKKASEQGYKDKTFFTYGDEGKNDFFMNPLFWQSLGKAMGWNETMKRADFYNQVYRAKNMGISQRSGGWIPESRYRWHRFIDHLAEGKDAESFFETL